MPCSGTEQMNVLDNSDSWFYPDRASNVLLLCAYNSTFTYHNKGRGQLMNGHQVGERFMVHTIVLLEKHLSMDESQLFEQVQFPLACKIRMQTMAGKRVMWPLRLLPTHMPNTFAVRTMYV